MTAARRTRPGSPLGVKILVVLYVAAFLLNLSGVKTVLSFSGFIGVLSKITLAILLAHLLAIVSLLTMQSWAWTAAKTTTVIVVAMDVLTIDLVAAMLHLVVLAYLYAKKPLYKGRRRSRSPTNPGIEWNDPPEGL